MSSLIRIYTVFRYVLIFDRPLFGIIVLTRFGNGRVYLRKPGMKGFLTVSHDCMEKTLINQKTLINSIID